MNAQWIEQLERDRTFELADAEITTEWHTEEIMGDPWLGEDPLFVSAIACYEMVETVIGTPSDCRGIRPGHEIRVVTPRGNLGLFTVRAIHWPKITAVRINKPSRE